MGEKAEPRERSLFLQDNRYSVTLPSVGSNELEFKGLRLEDPATEEQKRSFERHKFVSIDVDLFKDCKSHFAESDITEEIPDGDPGNLSDSPPNNYSILLGPGEMAPILDQEYQFDTFEGLDEDMLTHARRHKLSDQECEAILDALSHAKVDPFE